MMYETLKTREFRISIHYFSSLQLTQTHLH